uniref:Uncharacterized protein n=1 Tax=Rhodnius prolixus TaxID=13249 RepID=T1I661_RHOPR
MDGLLAWRRIWFLVNGRYHFHFHGDNWPP